MNFLSWLSEEIEASFLEFAKFGVSRSFHVASRSFHVTSHNVFGIRHVTHRIKTETRLCWPFRALITEMTHCGVNQLIAWHRPHFTFNPIAFCVYTNFYIYVCMVSMRRSSIDLLKCSLVSLGRSKIYLRSVRLISPSADFLVQESNVIRLSTIWPHFTFA